MRVFKSPGDLPSPPGHIGRYWNSIIWFLKSRDLSVSCPRVNHHWKHVGMTIRKLFLNAQFPDRLNEEIASAYTRLCEMCGRNTLEVAVRSSATAEDLPEASFAGMLESFLNVSGEEHLLAACRRCYASLFTDRAIRYREKMGFSHTDVALSIGVQQMVRADQAGAGVMFSIDKTSGFPNLIHISAAWGLGENVVQGTVIPDEYKVFKTPLQSSHYTPVVEKSVGAKEHKRVYMENETAGGTRNVETPEHERNTFVLSDSEILDLARWAVAVEAHAGMPMDMEWAKDGPTQDIFLVQARPLTAVPDADTPIKIIRPKTKGNVLLKGVSVGEGIAAGRVCLVEDYDAIDHLEEASVLVSPWANTGWVSRMQQKRVRGLITDFGGAYSHGAIISRELGIPGILGTLNATETLSPGQEITLSCIEGDNGFVYSGVMEYTETEIRPAPLPETRLNIMMNAPSEAAALKWWAIPCAGMGYVRMDVIFKHMIQVHPLAVTHPEALTDSRVREEIQQIARGYENMTEYFVDRLAGCVSEIAATRYPDPVIVCMSDMTSGEYALLKGGGQFEPDRDNPAYALRGVARYLSAHYREGFELECRAIRKAREEKGLDNIGVMLRYCENPLAAENILAILDAQGLSRGQNGLTIHLSVDMPGNVGNAEALSTKFDGFSLTARKLRRLIPSGSNEQGTLNNHGDVEPSVAGVLNHLMDTAHAAGHSLTVRGRTFGRSQKLIQFLTQAGIDALSVNPEAIPRIAKWVAEAEAFR
ncbi:MAG: phosphoenolpyruvate synthase [Deltaproteobacteria bacterium]|nr:phosphoenolpyruvate synthase [Deltaproteobacteria bacterium]